MLLKTIEQERAEAEAKVNGMKVIATDRRLGHSGAVAWWDDYDMDTTDTLYLDSNGKYYLRVEQYHEFMDADDVYSISRTEANEWLREHKRALYKAPRRRSRQILGTYGKRRYNFWKMIHKHWRKKAQKGA